MNDSSELNGTRIGARAGEKARASAKPRSVDPGEWTVILEPAAFGELLTYVMGHFSAQNFDEGSSFFSGKLDEKFFSRSVTIVDDYSNELAPGMPFDYEAQPKERVLLVDRGVVRNIVTDSYYAKKLGRENTGHALPAPNAFGPHALNVVVEPGAISTDDLIAQTTRGLLVTRFWYIRTVDQKRAIVTGMTRDGTFLIENGRITGGVKNLRFNQSIVEALGRTDVLERAPAHRRLLVFDCRAGCEDRRLSLYEFDGVLAARVASSAPAAISNSPRPTTIALGIATISIAG